MRAYIFDGVNVKGFKKRKRINDIILEKHIFYPTQKCISSIKKTKKIIIFITIMYFIVLLSFFVDKL